MQVSLFSHIIYHSLPLELGDLTALTIIQLANDLEKLKGKKCNFRRNLERLRAQSSQELPLYLILGMLCGVVSVVFTRLVVWFTKFFEFIKERFGLPAIVSPALGGLGAGIIALKYPGTLYWGFTNVDEILHTGKSASAPGIWLLAQLAAAKVVATALCKGSGLVGGLYAPSLMIGAAVGAVFGGASAELINLAIQLFVLIL